MSRSGPRTAPGGRAEAQHRLAFAEHCLGVVELIEDDGDPLSANVASAVAVLAGIAAADAACYLALGMRSRGQDHRQATDLLDQIRPGGGGRGDRPAESASARRMPTLRDARRRATRRCGG